MSNAIVVTKAIVTPMQRLVVEFDPVEVGEQPDHYEVTAACGEHTVEARVAAAARIARLPQVFRPATYRVEVSAAYAAPEDGVAQDPITGWAVDVDVQVRTGMANVIRQAVWDIVFDAGLALDSRPLTVIGDAYFRPLVMRRSETMAMRMPAAEIAMPTLQSSQAESSNRYAETWRVPMRLHEAGHPEDADSVQRLWYLWELVQGAVDTTENLNLGSWGVLSQAWSWSVEGQPVKGRDRMTGLEAALTVHVQRLIGRPAMG